jgi:hypothetical protein
VRPRATRPSVVTCLSPSGLGKNRTMRRAFAVNCVVLALVALVAGISTANHASRGLPLPLHTRVALTGQTLGSRPGQPATGRVFATAQWNAGPRYVVAVPSTDSSGRWRIAFHPSHRGRYTLRILTPDSGLLEYRFLVR